MENSAVTDWKWKMEDFQFNAQTDNDKEERHHVISRFKGRHFAMTRSFRLELRM